MVRYYPRPQKNIRLTCKKDYVRVSYPLNTPLATIENFVKGKSDWILKHQPPPLIFNPPQAIGRQHYLKLTPKHPRSYQKDQIIYTSLQDMPALEKIIKAVLKREATIILPKILSKLSQKTQLRPANLRIRYMQTQWGSCSAQRTICLNSALVYLPDNLIEYVILHELCHLRYLNHSPQFWQTLAAFEPDYQQARQNLKQYLINIIVQPRSSKSS